MRAMIRLAMVSITVAVVVALAITNVPAPVHARRPQVAIIGGGAHICPSNMHRTRSSGFLLVSKVHSLPWRCQLTFLDRLRLQQSGCGWTHSPASLREPSEFPLLCIHCLCSQWSLHVPTPAQPVVQILLRTPQLINYRKSMQTRNTSHQSPNLS